MPLFHLPGPPGFSAAHAGLPGRRPVWFQYTSFAAGAHLLFAGGVLAAGHKKCAARKKGQRISNAFCSGFTASAERREQGHGDQHAQHAAQDAGD